MAAYMVLTQNRTTDAAELDTYGQLASANLEGHKYKALAKHGALTVLEGPPIEAVVILEFETVAAAQAWYGSPAYKLALAHRKAGADCGMFIVAGKV